MICLQLCIFSSISSLQHTSKGLVATRCVSSTIAVYSTLLCLVFYQLKLIANYSMCIFNVS